jgi:uncharacterized protein YjbJ (UPF0337 family)
MNSDTLMGQWKQLVGEVKVRWGKLTDDDLARIEGDADKLAGAVQERYGVTREQAADQVRKFTERQQRASDHGPTV